MYASDMLIFAPVDRLVDPSSVSMDQLGSNPAVGKKGVLRAQICRRLHPWPLQATSSAQAAGGFSSGLRAGWRVRSRCLHPLRASSIPSPPVRILNSAGPRESADQRFLMWA